MLTSRCNESSREVCTQKKIYLENKNVKENQEVETVGEKNERKLRKLQGKQSKIA